MSENRRVIEGAINFIEALQDLSTDNLAARYGTVLLRVSSRPDGMAIPEIEKLTGIPRPTIHRAVGHFKGGGFMDSLPDPSGTHHVASLTPQGRLLVEGLLALLRRGLSTDDSKGTR